jgi:hypothetical protein
MRGLADVAAVDGAGVCAQTLCADAASRALSTACLMIRGINGLQGSVKWLSSLMFPACVRNDAPPADECAGYGTADGWVRRKICGLREELYLTAAGTVHAHRQHAIDGCALPRAKEELNKTP